MENRKKQITDLALKLIQEKGYVAISYDDLAKQLGVTKASIHYHFEKKEDLGVAVTDRVKQKLQSLFLKINDPSITIEDKITFFATTQIKQLTDGICPVSSLQTDFESLPKALQEKVLELSQIEISLMKQIVSENEQQRDVDEESTALMILSAIKGAMQYQRVMGIDLLPKVLEQIHRILMK
ncbi:TetR/AcrR family transcriptional regulator [Paenibacillus sp. Soil787]|jgi:TetR/AcrR family transcriptional repressor of nem operon|uniref:TetR/AcrR family transcriptional regulator n=1 Tax=Paenibacillus sp. Soil787 TaxID=1736411 RepID=UPI000702C07F|nr:TetR/AcrR family transcriptional regulator [Paenibacillus sp. Soil787]KRF21750.1 TetR family transcriptional regulator [Paenibacillus sp. Soil787]